jgi:hypothetical protein
LNTRHQEEEVCDLPPLLLACPVRVVIRSGKKHGVDRFHDRSLPLAAFDDEIAAQNHAVIYIFLHHSSKAQI